MTQLKINQNLDRIKKRGQIGGQLCKEQRAQQRRAAAERAFEDMLEDAQGVTGSSADEVSDVT